MVSKKEKLFSLSPFLNERLFKKNKKQTNKQTNKKTVEKLHREAKYVLSLFSCPQARGQRTFQLRGLIRSYQPNSTDRNISI